MSRTTGERIIFQTGLNFLRGAEKAVCKHPRLKYERPGDLCTFFKLSNARKEEGRTEGDIKNGNCLKRDQLS